MTFDPKGLLDAIADFLNASGLVQASVGMPADPPGTTWASVHPGSGRTAPPQFGGITLGTGSSEDTTRVRIWRQLPDSATADVEYEMARLPYNIWQSLAGNYDLNVASIQGFLADSFNWQHGEDEYKGVVYAVTDITFAFILNDVVTWAA